MTIRRIATLLAVVAAGLQSTGWTQVPDSVAAATGAQSLTAAEVLAAIHLGRSNRKSFAFRGATGRDLDNVEFAVVAQGPFGRIVSAAAEAAESNQPYSADSVTAQMMASVLVIDARPTAADSLGHSMLRAPPATHMFLRSRRAAQGDLVTVQPFSVRTFAVSQSNLTGGRLQGQGITAAFHLTGLPAEEFEIVVVAGDREYRRVVRARDREKLR